MNIPRPEHPRPDRLRSEWMNLNGEWEFSFDAPTFEGRILVPFCYQSELSGIHRPEEAHDTVWYRRRFEVPANFHGKRLLLHFGAVDFIADVWLDDAHIGQHIGGNTPFCFDITEAVAAGGAHEIKLRAIDTLNAAQPRGKQSWRGYPFGCFYTPVTGIWQTVWIEAVGQSYISQFRFTPDVGRRALEIDAQIAGLACEGMLTATALYGSGVIAQGAVRIEGTRARLSVTLPFEHDGEPMRLWSPEHPNLYDIRLSIVERNRTLDSVQSYFAMRSIAVEGDRLLLNDAPITMKLVLDQGYWQESLITPPSDEALRVDVMMTKRFGYTGARKHQKIEDPRYYYWADRLGLLVWSELPSAYEFTQQSMAQLSKELYESLQRDYNHPCIVVWTPLNESWGVPQIHSDAQQQNFANWVYYQCKALDPTRLVSTNDGWDQTVTDLVTIHDYTARADALSAAYADRESACFNGFRFQFAKGYGYAGQPILITEYAGIAMEKDTAGGGWGYNQTESGEEAFLERLREITDAFRALPYVRGWCLTQLTDVFQEVNGLMDMQRRPKIDPDAVAKINA